MKDVLVLGGIGKIGYDLVEKLLDTNSNITILDLESKKSKKKIEKIKDRIRVVYGDVEDRNLIMDLVKRNDIIIHYAGIMPPLANLNESISNGTNFSGVKNVVDSIKELNPGCVYIYMSFISIYGTSDNQVRRLSVTTESTYPDDFYSISIMRSEEYIKSNLKKYAIFRMPIVLTRKNYYIRHMSLNRSMNFITVDDLNRILMSVMKSKKIQGKTYNISGFKVKSDEVVKSIYQATGSLHLLNRNLYFGEYEDANAIESVCSDNKYTSLKEFTKELKKNTSIVKRTIKKIINFPKYIVFKKISKK